VNLPPLNHIIFIPVTILIGVMIGWALGTRAVRHEWHRAEQLRKKREEEA
jgi:hypothetical protein